jgi:hypothetical protein
MQPEAAFLSDAEETGANRLFQRWLEDLQLVEKAVSEGEQCRSRLRRINVRRVTVASGAPGTKTWDVFVSHPGETGGDPVDSPCCGLVLAVRAGCAY